ncbi:MAG: dodecin domain-containing protein [Chloroflexi bacterium]|nr:dodecin domain-containing protein [Chloroflexota bacterium]
MARIAKVIEIIGSSESSWQDAADSALQEAKKTVSHISGIEVGEMTADVQDGRVTAYHTVIKVAFAVERAE